MRGYILIFGRTTRDLILLVGRTMRYFFVVLSG